MPILLGVGRGPGIYIMGNAFKCLLVLVTIGLKTKLTVTYLLLLELIWTLWCHPMVNFVWDFFEDISRNVQLKKYSKKLFMILPLYQASNQRAFYKNVLSEAL